MVRGKKWISGQISLQQRDFQPPANSHLILSSCHYIRKRTVGEASFWSRIMATELWATSLINDLCLLSKPNVYLQRSQHERQDWKQLERTNKENWVWKPTRAKIQKKTKWFFKELIIWQEWRSLEPCHSVLNLRLSYEMKSVFTLCSRNSLLHIYPRKMRVAKNMHRMFIVRDKKKGGGMSQVSINTRMVK